MKSTKTEKVSDCHLNIVTVEKVTLLGFLFTVLLNLTLCCLSLQSPKRVM